MSKKLIIVIAIIVVVVIAGAVLALTVLKDKLAEVASAVIVLKDKLAGDNKETLVENVEGTLEEIMTKVYAGIPEENLPALMDMPVDSETVEGFLGTTEVSFKEAVAREPMMSSVPHSVVLVRLNDAKDAEAAVEKIKTSVNPRKWICVEASNVVVKSKGDLVILIMSDTEMTGEGEALAPKLEANFDNL
jgi:hypothetical protein